MPLDTDAELIGPYILDFECTLGLPCSLDVDGYDLSDSSSIVVLASGDCGDANAVAAAWTGAVVTEVALGGSGSAYGFGYATAMRRTTEATPPPTATATTITSSQRRLLSGSSPSVRRTQQEEGGGRFHFKVCRP